MTSLTRSVRLCVNALKFRIVIIYRQLFIESEHIYFDWFSSVTIETHFAGGKKNRIQRSHER